MQKEEKWFFCFDPRQKEVLVSKTHFHKKAFSHFFVAYAELAITHTLCMCNSQKHG
jgi:hypothetical protein